MELLILNSFKRKRKMEEETKIFRNRNIKILFLYANLLFNSITRFFISNTMLKLAKNQAKFKQHPEPELLLTENYSFSSHFVIRNIFYINVGFIGLKPPTYFSQNVLSISCNIFKVIKVTSYSPCFIRF